MNFSEYQKGAARTAIYPKSVGIAYTILGLASEAGEIAGKFKKIIRDKEGKIGREERDALLDELGDVLWYVAMIAHELDCPLDSVAFRNIQKLASRKARNKLSGSGDNR